MDEKEFVIKITADASGVADTLDRVDDKITETEQHANELSSDLGNASTVGEKLAGVASQMANSLDYASKVSGYMERAFADARIAVEPLGEALAGSLTGIDGQFSGFASELEDVQKRLISSQVSLEGLGDRLKDALAGVTADTPRATVNELISLDKTVEKLNGSYEKQSDKIIDIKLALMDAQKQLEALHAAQSSIVNQTQKDLTITEARLNEYKDRAQETIAAGFNPSAGLKRTIQSLEVHVQRLRDGLAGDHMQLPGFRDYANQISTLEGTISTLRGNLEKETAAIADTDSQTARYAARITSLTEAQTGAAGSGSRLTAALAAIGSRMAAAASVAGKMAKSLVNIGKVGLGNIKTTAAAIAKVFTMWTKPIARVGNVLSGLSKKVSRFFGTMAWRLKRLAITAIFHDVSKNSGQIAQISSTYNAAISSMVSSARALGAQLVAIAEPIISIAGPAISRFIDILTAGADKLAQFTARLAGRDTYIQASKGAYDYAAAMQESEDSTKKATKANQKFKASVMDFDELHKLEDNSRDTDDSSAITGVTDSQLAKAKIQTNAISELADKIRNAINTGDFWGLGRIMADEVVKAFSWLQNIAGWSKNATKFTDTLKHVIDVINGFWAGLNAGKIGAAIGDVLNTVVNGAAMLLHKIDATVIGAKIGNIFSSFSQTFDWHTAGNNIIAAFQFVIDMVNGFLMSGALSQIGAGIARFFAGMVDEFDPAHVGAVLGNAVNGISEFLANSFNPETFQTAGQKVAEAINTLFATIRPEQVGEGINSLIQAISGFLTSLLSGLDLSQITATLAEIGSKLDWGSIFEIIAIAALPALIPAAVGLAGQGIAALGGAIIGGLPAIGTAVSGLISGVGAIAGAGVPVLIAGIAAAALAAIVVNWDTIKDWAGKAWERIKEWGGKIADFFGGVIKGAVDGIKSIGEGIGNAVSGVGSWMQEKMQGVKNWFIGDVEASQANMTETTIAGASMLTPTSLACADAETVLARLEASFTGAVQIATNSILNALNQSGDIMLYVDSERLARATVRGLNLADIRQNAGSLAFV